MSATPTPPRPKAPAREPTDREPFVGLRLRLWLACVAGGAIAGLGSMWVLGTRAGPAAAGTGELHAWLAAVAFAAVGAGMLLAFWIDHHVVGHLRGLLRGLRSGRVAELRGLPSAAGWGELSELTEIAQGMLVRQRHSAGAAQDLEHVRAQLAALQAAADRWLRTEVWEAPALANGPVTETTDALTRGFARRAGVDEQNGQVARQVAEELAAALADAQESAEQAEAGFVEATAMLTTVRELQRLSGELHTALLAMGAPAAPLPPAVPTPEGDAAPDGDATREAIEDLVVASRESVDAIGSGMLRVQDVAALVQKLANRATLVAIHAVTSGRRGADPGGDIADELKHLVQDVREATDRTTQLTGEIETAVAEASDRMRAARERAIARLDEPAEAPATPAPPPAPQQARALDDARRLLERVREMVQDAARKGERLSAAGERSSRAAERLSRRVAEESAEAQALVVRLAPSGAGEPSATTPSRELRLYPGRKDAADPAPDTESGAGADRLRRGEDLP